MSRIRNIDGGHIGGRPRRSDHQQPRRRRQAARQIQSGAGSFDQRAGIDTLVVAGAEEHHQCVIGLDRPGGQILEDAAVVSGRGITGFALGRHIARDPRTPRTEHLPGARRPRSRAQTALIRCRWYTNPPPPPHDSAGSPASVSRKCAPAPDMLMATPDQKTQPNEKGGQTTHSHLHCQRHRRVPPRSHQVFPVSRGRPLRRPSHRAGRNRFQRTVDRMKLTVATRRDRFSR